MTEQNSKNFSIYMLDSNQDTKVYHDVYHITFLLEGRSSGFVSFSSSCMKEFYCDSSFGIFSKGEKLIVGYAEYSKIFEENLPVSLVKKFFKLHDEVIQTPPDFDKEGNIKKLNEDIDLELSSIIKEKLPEHCI